MAWFDKLRFDRFWAEGPFGKRPVREYTARETRQGEIVLDGRMKRALFIGGLAASLILGVFILLAS